MIYYTQYFATIATASKEADMTSKERFIEIYRANIKREGAEELLNFLLSDHSDFLQPPPPPAFTARTRVGCLSTA